MKLFLIAIAMLILLIIAAIIYAQYRHNRIWKTLEKNYEFKGGAFVRRGDG